MPDTLQKFLDNLDRYGGRIENWPPQEHADAQSLLESSAEARAQFSAVTRMEAALATTQPDAAGTLDAMAQRAMQAKQIRPVTKTARRMTWAFAGTLALVAGLYVGSLNRRYETQSDVIAATLDQGGHDVW